MSNDKRVYRLLKSKKISIGKAEDGTFLCSIPHNGNKEILDIHSSNFRMADKYEYVNTPTECLNELKHIALQKGIDKSTLPKDGSRLTKALILIRDELSEVYGLNFEQKRGKERLYVVTNKNLEEELDEE